MSKEEQDKDMSKIISDKAIVKPTDLSDEELDKVAGGSRIIQAHGSIQLFSQAKP